MKAIGYLSFLPLLALAQTDATVQGHVIDKLTGMGIANVRVDLREAVIYQTVTDSSGAFTLKNVKAGAYKATFTDPQDRFYSTLSGNRQGQITISAGSQVRLDAEMQPPGRLSVRVIGVDGKPFARAVVSAGNARFPPSWEADEDGLVHFAWQAGLIWLGAGPPDDLSPPKGFEWRCPPAKYVLVRGGAETVVDFQIGTAPVTSNRVRGVVLNEAGRPAKGTTVNLIGRREEVGHTAYMEECIPTSCLYSGGGGGFSWPQTEATTKTLEGGDFEFPSVPTGNWRFQVEFESPNGQSLRGSTTATISRDVEGIEIRLARSFNVQPVIEWQGHSELDEIYRHTGAGLVSLDAPPSDDRLGFWTVESQPLEGVFPGRYLVDLGPSRTPGFYPTSVRLGAREVLGEEFMLSASSPPLRLVFREGAATLRAIIEKPEKVLLLLYPQKPDLTHIIRGAICRGDGACEISCISPGDYYAFVFRGAGGPDLGSPDFLRAVISNAASVHLSERAVVTVKLPFTDWPE